MSRTISDGVVGPGYWTLMAADMADLCDRWLQARCVVPEQKHVLHEAHRFFDLAVRATSEGRVNKRPPLESWSYSTLAQIRAYLIAMEVLHPAPLTYADGETRREVERQLIAIGVWVQSQLASDQPHPLLTEEEIEAVRNARDFFLQLRQLGAKATAWGNYRPCPPLFGLIPAA